MDCFQTLNYLKTDDEKKKWPRMWRSFQLRRRGFIARHIVGQVFHLLQEASLVMYLLREAAWREEQIHGCRAALQESCIAPPLRRAVEFQCTTQTLWLLPKPLLIFPNPLPQPNHPTLL